MSLEKVRYNAFISYRHSELDMYVAKTLMSKLENFKVPKDIKEVLPPDRQKIERIFRDQDELPLAENLSDPIEEALRNAEFLIVICTPRLPQSKWCLKEIETFIKLRGRDHVLAVLAEGEPEESFPEILTKEIVETTDENGDKITNVIEYEPLAAEARGKNRFAINKALDDAKIRIAASLLHVNYDDLKQRHKEQHQKKMLRIAGIIGGAVSIFAIVCFALLLKISHQKSTIEDQYTKIQYEYATAMADQSREYMERGKRDEAVSVLLDAMPQNEKDSSAPYNPDAVYALSDALGVYDAKPYMYPTGCFDEDSAVLYFAVSKDGNLLCTVNENMTADIWDCEDKKADNPIGSFDVENEDNAQWNLHFAGDDAVVYSNGTELIYYNISKDKKESLLEGETVYFVSSENDDFYAFCDGSFTGYDSDANETFSLDLVSDIDAYMDDCCLLDMKSYEGGVLFAYSSFMDDLTVIGNVDIEKEDIGVMFTYPYADDARLAKGSDSIVVSYYNLHDYGMSSGNVICAYDDVSAADLMMYDLGSDFARSIEVYDDGEGEYVFANMGLNLTAIDLKGGYEINSVPLNASMLTSYEDEDGRCFVACSDDRLYEFDLQAYNLIDVTSNNFGIEPNGNPAMAVKCGEKLFYLLSGTDYVSMYEYSDTEIKCEEFDEDDVIDYTEDAEYTVRTKGNGEVEIYSDDEPIKTLTGIRGEYKGLATIYEDELYALNVGYNAYLLDRNMDVIGKTLLYNDEEDGMLQVYDGECFYYVPVCGYDELIEKAVGIMP